MGKKSILSIKQYQNKLKRLEKTVVWVILFLCIFPWVLSWFGIDIEVSDKVSSSTDTIFVYNQETGSLIHTLLEWSAVCVAMLITVLAFVHYAIQKDPLTLILGVSIFWSGCMNAAHILIATDLLFIAMDNENFSPFTWFLCRLFHAIALLIGASLLIWNRLYASKKLQFRFFLSVGLFLGLLGYLGIYLLASVELPATMFPDSFIKRPWDLIPLSFYLICGAFIYPYIHRMYESHFSFALWICIIPEIAVELYMSLGSGVLFDYNFQVAHFLQVLSYLVILFGLILDYVYTYQVAKIHAHSLMQQTKKLEKANKSLEQFAFAASHDLQEPLRMVVSYTQLLEKRYQDRFDEKGKKYIGYAVEGATRMKKLIRSLLLYSSLRIEETTFSLINSQKVLEEVLQILSDPIQEINAKITSDTLPEINSNTSQLKHVFQNLLENALTFRNTSPLCIHISTEQNSYEWVFSVKDNGLGIESEYQHRVWDMFTRLHARQRSSGSGIGLTIVKEIIQYHGGRVWLESEIEKGSTFYFSIPKSIEKN